MWTLPLYKAHRIQGSTGWKSTAFTRSDLLDKSFLISVRLTYSDTRVSSWNTEWGWEYLPFRSNCCKKSRQNDTWSKAQIDAMGVLPRAAVHPWSRSKRANLLQLWSLLFWIYGFRNWVYICIIRLEHIFETVSLKVCALLEHTTVDGIKLRSKGRKYSGGDNMALHVRRVRCRSTLEGRQP